MDARPLAEIRPSLRCCPALGPPTASGWNSNGARLCRTLENVVLFRTTAELITFTACVCPPESKNRLSASPLYLTLPFSIRKIGSGRPSHTQAQAHLAGPRAGRLR